MWIPPNPIKPIGGAPVQIFSGTQGGSPPTGTKNPTSGTTEPNFTPPAPVFSVGLQSLFAFTPANIIGIPKVTRAALLNTLTMRMDVNDSFPTMSSRPFGKAITEQDAASISQFQKIANLQVESTGLRTARGGFARAFLLSDALFARYGSNTPEYHVTAFLASVVVEIGDYVTLTHTKVPDFIAGNGELGLANVVCEVTARKPNYSRGQMEFTLLDTRAFALTPAFEVAPSDGSVPAWAAATTAQREQYMFISANALGGENADGSPGNTVF